ncbi:MAG: DUF1488 family protein [Proteobacteria bacterium]|nr:DUF1488 family protein [Pseudomonadota bacterium]
MSLKFEDYIHIVGADRAWVYGIDDNHTYQFAVTAEALEEHFGMEGTVNMSDTVKENREIIEAMWRVKFNAGEFGNGDTILLTVDDSPA